MILFMFSSLRKCRLAPLGLFLVLQESLFLLCQLCLFFYFFLNDKKNIFAITEPSSKLTLVHTTPIQKDTLI